MAASRGIIFQVREALADVAEFLADKVRGGEVVAPQVEEVSDGDAGISAFRELNYSVTVGEDANYLAVENNFDSVEISVMKQQEVQGTVTLTMAELEELLPSLKFVTESSLAYHR